MMGAEYIKGFVFEDGSASLMSRVIGSNGEAVQQADITGISMTVWDLSTETPTEVTGLTDPVVADTIFDTLQTDSRWTKDSTGYNFRHDLPPAAFPNGDRKYRVEYLFDPASGTDFFVVFELTALQVYTS